jgi:hypothetical protein
MSLTARALRSDVVRRAASRADAPRRAALPIVNVDKSYTSHRPSQHGWSQGSFKTALLS